MEHGLQLAAIFGTIGLLWLVLQALRRFRPSPAPDSLVQVRQRVALANGLQLVVVHWDGRELLLATGNQTCSLVASKTASQPVLQTEASGAWAQ